MVVLWARVLPQNRPLPAHDLLLALEANAPYPHRTTFSSPSPLMLRLLFAHRVDERLLHWLIRGGEVHGRLARLSGRRKRGGVRLCWVVVREGLYDVWWGCMGRVCLLLASEKRRRGVEGSVKGEIVLTCCGCSTCFDILRARRRLAV